MAAPLFKVEVAFAAGPNTAAPSWTDISSYVRRRPPLTYSRGNTDETSQLQSGSMRFVVDNTDGRFTPGSSASTSAWGTALKIRRPVRLSIWDGSAYTVEWTGTVDDWGAGWKGGRKGESLVTCSDRVAQAGRVTMPNPIEGEIAQLITSTAFGWYYPMDETSGPLLHYYDGGASLSVGSWGDDTASIDYRVDGPGLDGAFGIAFSNVPTDNGGFYAFGAPAGIGSSSQSSISTWARFTAASPTFDQVMVQVVSGADKFELVMDTLGRAVANVESTTNGTVTGRPIDDGEWHHIAATLSSGTLTLYVDGVSQGTAAYTATGTTYGNVFLSGRNAGPDMDTISAGVLSHAAGSGFAWTAAQVGYIAVAGSTTAAELPGSRWNRLCREAGMGSAFYAADTGTVELAQQAIAGQSLASLLQTVAEAEQGYAYADAAGVLTLKAGTTRYGATSAATFTPQQADPGLQWITNDAYLVNDAEITREGGGTRRSVSTTSKSSYGTYRTTATLPFLLDDQCSSLASWLTYKYAEPGTRADGLTLDVTAKALTASTILGIDVNSLITLSPLPAPAPASSVALFVDGLEGSIGDTWEVSYKTSPGTLYDGWTLDTDLLDTGTLLLY